MPYPSHSIVECARIKVYTKFLSESQIIKIYITDLIPTGDGIAFWQHLNQIPSAASVYLGQIDWTTETPLLDYTCFQGLDRLVIGFRGNEDYPEWAVLTDFNLYISYYELPYAPLNFTATSDGLLQWEHPSGPRDGYHIHLSTDPAFSSYQLITKDKHATSHYLTGLQENTLYHVRIAGYRQGQFKRYDGDFAYANFLTPAFWYYLHLDGEPYNRGPQWTVYLWWRWRTNQIPTQFGVIDSSAIGAYGLFDPDHPDEPRVRFGGCSDTLALYPSWSPKIVVDSLENLHIVFTSGDSIYYVYNEIYYTRKTETWTPPVPIYQNPAVRKIAPPAFAVDRVNNLAYLCMKEEYADRSEITKGVFDLNPGTITTTRLDWSPALDAFASPSLSLTRDGVPIIAWSKKGKVYLNDGVQTIEIPTGDAYAIHPSVTAVGDNIKLIWTATNGYDDTKQLYYCERSWWGWMKPLPLKEGNFVTPPIITGTDHILYCEDANDTTYLKYLGISEDGWHTYVRMVAYNDAGMQDINACYFAKWPAGSVYTLFYVPDEAIVKMIPIPGPNIPIVYLNCGNGQSPYTTASYQNWHYSNLPAHTVDIDSQRLDYHFTGFNPMKRYRIKITAFQDEQAEIRQWVKIDGQKHGQFKVPRRKIAIFEKWLEPPSYADAEIFMSLEKKNGFTTASEISIEEYNRGDNDKEIQRQAIQSYDENSASSVISILPNPTSGSAKISFDLKKQEVVTLKIYDNTGRFVKNLAQDKLKPGNHKIIWDRTDDNRNSVPAGIYFLIFATEQNKEMQKIILLK